MGLAIEYLFLAIASVYALATLVGARLSKLYPGEFPELLP